MRVEVTKEKNARGEGEKVIDIHSICQNPSDSTQAQGTACHTECTEQDLKDLGCTAGPCLYENTYT